MGRSTYDGVARVPESDDVASFARTMGDCACDGRGRGPLPDVPGRKAITAALACSGEMAAVMYTNSSSSDDPLS